MIRKNNIFILSDWQLRKVITLGTNAYQIWNFCDLSVKENLQSLLILCHNKLLSPHSHGISSSHKKNAII